jgi:hypothetical protein
MNTTTHIDAVSIFNIVEEISEMVGYNSKTASNNTFAKLLGKISSEFRKSFNS